MSNLSVKTEPKDEKLCRACLKNDSVLENLFANRLDTIFFALTAIPVNENDRLPVEICKNCSGQLRNFANFRHQCINSDSFLRNRLEVEDIIKVRPQETKKLEVEPILDIKEEHLGDSSKAIEFAAPDTLSDHGDYSEEEEDRGHDDGDDEGDDDFNIEDEIVELPKKRRGRPPLAKKAVKVEKAEVRLRRPRAEGPRMPWTKKATYKTEQEAEQAIADLGKWGRHFMSKSNKGQKVYYRCGYGKSRGEIKCPAKLCLFFEDRTGKIQLLEKAVEHNHEGVIPSGGRQIPAELQENIISLFNSGVTKPKAIHRIFINKGIEEVKYVQIRHFLANYKKDTFGGWREFQELHKQAEPVNLECDRCGKVMNGRDGFVRHWRRFHSSDFEWQRCDQCNKAFRDRPRLEAHRNLHTKEIKYICYTCGMIFYQSSSLKAHVDNVHLQIRPFACDQCPKTYRTKSLLLDHQLAVHIGCKQFTCELCDKSFARKTSLSQHHLVVHSGVKREYKYECTTCDKKFFNKTQYRYHSMIHSDERPFQCVICLKAFRLNSKLKRHMNTHNESQIVNQSLPVIYSDQIRTEYEVLQPIVHRPDLGGQNM